MLTIWGRDNSMNVKKVLWCADELGLPFTYLHAGGEHGRVNDPDYRALNPNGLVPCLQDGDLVLWESNVIVRYLAAAYGGGVLCPADLRQRADADRWMEWYTTTFAPAFRPVFLNLVRTAPEARDAAAVAAGVAACGDLLRVLDARLAASPYLSGQAFGMGDIPFGVVAYAWFSLPIDRPDLPHLAAWYARLQDRPAYRARVMIPLT